MLHTNLNIQDMKPPFISPSKN